LALFAAFMVAMPMVRQISSAMHEPEEGKQRASQAPPSRPAPPTGTDAPVPMSATPPAPNRPVHHAVEARRQQLEAAVAQARRRRLAQSTGRPSEPLALANKTGSNEEWEQRQLATLNTLLAECYDLARATEPELAGKLGVQFSISAEPEVGGLVDEVQLMDDYSTIESASMRECVTESMYALELDPPPEGVTVARQVTLSFGAPERIDAPGGSPAH